MNFVESLFDSVTIGVKQVSGEYPNYIETYCIGSGSYFEVHKNISNKMAAKIYEKYKSTLSLGTRVSKKDVGGFVLEEFNTMESSTGYTYTFLFKIDKVEVHNPNDIIDEWIENNKKHKDFMNSLLEIFTTKRKEKKS